ncbi:hypothetical protein HAX54_034460 [Datura stramonium]|uniref:Fatty acid desaturase domain-containing protein n=1 Tax=Datura stramonium TaxID=4076 RepID=A0ABS8SE71_DATST|nr:hypothetical protein [Datura stramonium]
MATDFFWSYTDEPRSYNRKPNSLSVPSNPKPFWPDPFAFLKISMVVLLQLWTATFLHDASWLKILMVALLFGSFLNHNLFLAIHELSHNLAFSTPVYNRWLGIFANLPIGVPMSVTFQKYHLEHHRFQGVDGMDMDVPSLAEAHVVKMNLKINMGRMHPMAGHFISEHYVFNPEQETYSYYGPLNLMTWSVGYHMSTMIFRGIPGSKLFKVKEIAPEYYENLESYKSWSQVIYMYVMEFGLHRATFSRMKRKLSTKTDKKSE